jgi:hypothetical protein
VWIPDQFTEDVESDLVSPANEISSLPNGHTPVSVLLVEDNAVNQLVIKYAIILIGCNING